MRAVADEIHNLTTFDAEAVFALLFVTVGHDAMNTGAQLASLERKAADGSTVRIDQVQQAFGYGAGKLKHAATAFRVVPGRNADQSGAATYVKFVGEIHARRQRHATTYLGRGVERFLEGERIVGFTAASHVEHRTSSSIAPIHCT